MASEAMVRNLGGTEGDWKPLAVLSRRVTAGVFY